MTKIVFLILTILLGADDWVIASQEPNYKFYYSEELKTSRWLGHPDPNYAWEDERLVWERIVKDENGKDVLVKTYKDPFEIIANFKPESKVFGVEGNIEKVAVKKFGGALKGFVWLDNVSGGGEVVLPFTAPHIFIATGDRLNPELTEIGTDPNSDNYYKIIEGKTRVVVKSFSGIGGASGQPPELIAHYKMNDNLATAVVVDETGNHNGEYQLNNVAQNTDTGNEPGKILGALDFVGGGFGDHIEIPDHADFTPALTPFSMSVWVYMHDAANFVIVTKGVLNIDGEWEFRTNGDGEYYARFIDNDVGNCRIGARYATAITSYENQWIHLVVTYDGGILSSGVKLYLNGESLDVEASEWNANSFVAVENLNAPVRIGKYGVTYADGLIDTPTFFSLELTLEDVEYLYNNGQGREDWDPREPFLGRLNRPLDYPFRRGRYTF